MSKALQPIICLIEDDEIMGDSLFDRFDLEGFRVDWHRTGLGGMRAISNKNYDLVISDIHLPDLNGEEVFTRLSDENSATCRRSFSSPATARSTVPCACSNWAQRTTSASPSISTCWSKRYICYAPSNRCDATG